MSRRGGGGGAAFFLLCFLGYSAYSGVASWFRGEPNPAYDHERAEAIREEERRLAAIQADQEAAAKRERREEAEQRARESAIETELSALREARPTERQAKLRACVDKPARCSVGAARIVETAPTEAERRKLAALHDQLNRHRHWASAPLLCRDGMLSPTCECGRPDKRGCCSHHGGIAGCSVER